MKFWSNTSIFIPENAFENVICETAFICFGLNVLTQIWRMWLKSFNVEDKDSSLLYILCHWSAWTFWKFDWRVNRVNLHSIKFLRCGLRYDWTAGFFHVYDHSTGISTENKITSIATSKLQADITWRAQWPLFKLLIGLLYNISVMYIGNSVSVDHDGNEMLHIYLTRMVYFRLVLPDERRFWFTNF